MKYEWKKEEKEYYLPKSSPILVTIPKYKFFTLSGKGNPNNNPEFSEKIGLLYSMSYTIRMMPKQGIIPEGYYEYTVYPLEGVWDFAEEVKDLKDVSKDEFIYTIMIRQPDFVNDDVVKTVAEIVKKKKPNQYIDELKFMEIEDGLSVQMLHIGSYDDETSSFDMMKNYMAQNNLSSRSYGHREIYISDPRRVEKDKLKTVLRYMVRVNETE